jgi:two-component system, NtrC family, response regulator HydG
MDKGEMVGFWKTIVDTMMDGLVVVDADGMIVAVNRATEEITGFEREELIGSPCTILNCDQCSARESDGTFTCDLFETKQIEKRRCTLTRKDGVVLPVVKNAAVLTGNDGKVNGGVETITDLSEIVTRDLKIARLSSILKGKDSFHGIVGKSRPMQDVYDLIADAAQSLAPIIIYGESGTGKELVAAAIHKLGRRKHGPLVKVNCAALTESLLESELFGHVKGAYTGADRDRKGRFELADGGDIFLDEIGDIPLSMQVKILRVLQEKEFERVGDSVPRKVDARIISATHRDLPEMISRNQFREDLFYRLNVIPIRLPPLRERPQDLPLLIEHFIEENRFKTGKDITGISNEAMDRLISYSWPGNIRELLNAVEYAFVVCRQAYIDERHLPEALKNGKPPRLPAKDGHGERDRIVEAMRQAGGKKVEAARLLGITRQALWKKMVKLGIKKEFTFNAQEFRPLHSGEHS